MKKETLKQAPLRVYEKIVFTFAVERNAQNVAYALCSAGYLVNIKIGSSGYLVYVYGFNN